MVCLLSCHVVWCCWVNVISTYNKVFSCTYLSTFCLPDGVPLKMSSICWSLTSEAGWETDKQWKVRVSWQWGGQETPRGLATRSQGGQHGAEATPVGASACVPGAVLHAIDLLPHTTVIATPPPTKKVLSALFYRWRSWSYFKEVNNLPESSYQASGNAGTQIGIVCIAFLEEHRLYIFSLILDRYIVFLGKVNIENGQTLSPSYLG